MEPETKLAPPTFMPNEDDHRFVQRVMLVGALVWVAIVAVLVVVLA